MGLSQLGTRQTRHIPTRHRVKSSRHITISALDKLAILTRQLGTLSSQLAILQVMHAMKQDIGSAFIVTLLKDTFYSRHSVKIQYNNIGSLESAFFSRYLKDQWISTTKTSRKTSLRIS